MLLNFSSAFVVQWDLKHMLIMDGRHVASYYVLHGGFLVDLVASESRMEGPACLMVSLTNCVDDGLPGTLRTALRVSAESSDPPFCGALEFLSILEVSSTPPACQPGKSPQPPFAALPIIPEVIIAASPSANAPGLKAIYALRLLRLVRVVRLLKVRPVQGGKHELHNMRWHAC